MNRLQKKVSERTVKQLGLKMGVFVLLGIVWFSCQKKDASAPTVALNGSRIDTVDLHGNYVEMGVTAFDTQDGDLTTSVVVAGNLNVDLAGIYTIGYAVSDKAGNRGETSRTVIVRHTQQTIMGSYTVNALCDSNAFNYTELFTQGTALRLRRFGNYDSANVYLLLSGGTNSLIAVPSQTVLCGQPPVTHVFKGSGTITPNGNNLVMNYTDETSSDTLTCRGNYVK